MNSPIQVAQVFRTLEIGGMETLGRSFVQALADDTRVQIHVLCLEHLGTIGERMASSNECSIHALEFTQNSVLNKIDLVADFFRSRSIDVVHTHNVGAHLWGNLGALRAGVPLRLNTRHGLGIGYDTPRYRAVSSIASLFSQHLVMVSHELERRISKLDWVRDGKLSTIHNGIDTNAMASVVDVRAHQNDQPFRFGCVARMSTEKDHPTLLRAFSKLRVVTGPLPVLRLVGDGPEMDSIRSLADELKIADRVEFRGFRSDVQQELAELDAFVLSTHTEGISISLLEAMASALPVIATAVGGNVEIIDHGNNGLLVEHLNPIELTSSMQLLLDDNSSARRLSLAGQTTARSAFDVTGMTRKYVELYLQN